MSAPLSISARPRQSLTQRLQVKQSQRLALRQQQSIRLLQLSNAELHAEIQQKLESNIMLEQDGGETDRDEPDALQHPDSPLESAPQDPSAQADPPEAQSGAAETSSEPEPPSVLEQIPDELPADIDWTELYDDEPPAPRPAAAARDDVWEYRDVHVSSLYSCLMEQLQQMPVSDQQAEQAAAIIRALDEDGFLRCSLEELGADLEADAGQLENALHLVQAMEPPGVAARDVGECLLLQLRELPAGTPCLELARCIVKEHLPLLEGRLHGKLARRLRLADGQLEQALSLLRSLVPRPGNLVGDQGIEYIKPDLFLSESESGAWQVELNEELYPRLTINRRYRRLLRQRGLTPVAQQTGDGKELLKAHLEEARWFKSALKNRGDTLKKVAECIVRRQAGFFHDGVQRMRPLNLQQVAEMLKVHESTVSRAVNKKYMQTPRGTFELKYFFSSGVATIDGGVCSNQAVRSKIQQLVREEDPAHPLSDKRIAELLLEQGISIARRTVAKYRTSAHILSASQRRRVGEGLDARRSSV